MVAANAMLGYFSNWGGATNTIYLEEGSPAIDAGDDALVPSGITTDQRGSGYDRIAGGAVDIGAYEEQGAAATFTPTFTTTFTDMPTETFTPTFTPTYTELPPLRRPILKRRQLRLRRQRPRRQRLLTRRLKPQHIRRPILKRLVLRRPLPRRLPAAARLRRFLLTRQRKRR
ncbi:MAG: Na-Ca exchanger/integrin-beta4 [Chloroflexi bacterium OLB15]|nr:MAG: Na-Ca exchanger/integrin-beta4 [Chloroflexi bacterium OLB15]